jgi:FAD/FMN-containing dehydrogenase
MNDQTLNTFKTEIKGTVILPTDAEYDTVRKNAEVTLSPAIIVQVATNQDIITALEFAKTHQLEIAVRSGGHSGAGFSSTEGGLVIDLRHMNTVEVIDKDAGIVKIGTGAIWGDVAKKLGEYNLAISSGDTSTVGVGGLTLGGGFGWMIRKYGLAIDSLLEADIITANGDVLTVNDKSNTDLYWAIRGGGGNFGVVTSFTFQAHPVTAVYHGTFTYNKEKLREVIDGFAKAMHAAPEELNATLMAMPQMGPQMPPAVKIIVVYADDNEQAAMAAIEPLTHIDGFKNHEMTKKKYADVLEERPAPEGVKIISNNTMAQQATPEIIDATVNFYENAGQSVLMIRSISGAFNRVSSSETAFAFRDNKLIIISGVLLPLESSKEDEEHVAELWSHITKYTNGMYSNFLNSDTKNEAGVIYPESTYQRLLAIKQQYDPDNIFHRNYNIVSLDQNIN